MRALWSERPNRSHNVSQIFKRIKRFKFQRIGRDKLHGTNGFLQNFAVSCNFLRKSAVSCDFLQKSAPPKCSASLEKREAANIWKKKKNCEFGSVCPF